MGELPSVATLVVDKAAIGFAAAHFSILEGGSERIHGHNYHVAVRARGRVGARGTVVDFARIKEALVAECDALDHRMLLPAECPDVVLSDDGEGGLEVREGDRRFVFPRDEVCLLPVRNTTCECLAGLLAVRLRDRLGDLAVKLEVTVEESPGQGVTVTESEPM
jgi:6-pyruvoyltetrahydropterin/6-carboxytetrahydropterin synthase